MANFTPDERIQKKNDVSAFSADTKKKIQNQTGNLPSLSDKIPDLKPVVVKFIPLPEGFDLKAITQGLLTTSNTKIKFPSLTKIRADWKGPTKLTNVPMPSFKKSLPVSQDIVDKLKNPLANLPSVSKLIPEIPALPKSPTSIDSISKLSDILQKRPV